MARRFALTILLTVCVGTLVLISLEALLNAVGVSPPRAIALMAGIYTGVAAVFWRVFANFEESANKKVDDKSDLT